MKTRELKDKRPAEVKQLEKALLRRKWTSREKIRQGIYTDTDKALGAEAVKDIGPKRKAILDLMVMAPDHEWVNYFPMIPLAEDPSPLATVQEATAATEKPPEGQ
jgi:hypothetical protein